MHIMDHSQRIMRWLGILKLTGLLITESEAPDHEYLVYVGTYSGKVSEGIYVYGFDAATGESNSVGLVAATDNPSFVTVDPNIRFLYGVNELDGFHNKLTGAVNVFAIDRESGQLKRLQQVSSFGAGLAHLSFDKLERYLMVANYDGEKVAAFQIRNDGGLGIHSAFVKDFGSRVNPERQARTHAHSMQVTNDNRFTIPAYFGLDKLLAYQFDAKTGSLTPDSPKFIKVDPGARIRHIVFAPTGKFVYLVNEMASTV